MKMNMDWLLEDENPSGEIFHANPHLITISIESGCSEDSSADRGL